MNPQELVDAFDYSHSCAQDLYAQLDTYGGQATRLAVSAGACLNTDTMAVLPASQVQNPRTQIHHAKRVQTAHQKLHHAADKPDILRRLVVGFAPLMAILHTSIPALQSPLGECSVHWLRSTGETRPAGTTEALVRINFAWIRTDGSPRDNRTSVAALLRCTRDALETRPAAALFSAQSLYIAAHDAADARTLLAAASPHAWKMAQTQHPLVAHP